MTSPYDVLSRITSRRPQPLTGERCEMCSESIADEHQHVVNVAGRQLMCVCRGCYLLFTDSTANLRYRAVPDRFLSFPDFMVDRHAWDALQIPVGMSFFSATRHWVGLSRSTQAQPGHASPSWISISGMRSRPRTAGPPCWSKTSKRC